MPSSSELIGQDRVARAVRAVLHYRDWLLRQIDESTEAKHLTIAGNEDCAVHAGQVPNRKTPGLTVLVFRYLTENLRLDLDRVPDGETRR